jgi:hypothetical protein
MSKGELFGKGEWIIYIFNHHISEQSVPLNMLDGVGQIDDHKHARMDHSDE